MEPVVGIFNNRSTLAHALAELQARGFGPDKVSLMCPGTDGEPEPPVLTSDTESAGMGAALGGTIGAAFGAAGAATLGTALASFVVPGIGPIVVIGLLAATFGAGGAIVGAAAGHALEHGLAQGLPHDELFIYEDALRKGRSVVLVMTSDEPETEKARDILALAGAESVDAARNAWWLGLRAPERETYEKAGGDFVRDEPNFRCGFEAALLPSVRGRSFNEAETNLKKIYGGRATDQAFRAGYNRGLAYQRYSQAEDKAITEQAMERGAAGKSAR